MGDAVTTVKKALQIITQDTQGWKQIYNEIAHLNLDKLVKESLDSVTLPESLKDIIIEAYEGNMTLEMIQSLQKQIEAEGYTPEMLMEAFKNSTSSEVSDAVITAKKALQGTPEGMKSEVFRLSEMLLDGVDNLKIQEVVREVSTR